MNFKQVKLDNYLMLLVKLSSVGLMFLVNVILARYMTMHEFGQYSYLMSILTIAVIFVIWGSDKSVLRLFSLKGEKNKIEINSSMSGLAGVVIINTFISAVVILVFIENSQIQRPYIEIWAALVFCLFLLSIGRISATISKGLGMPILSELVFNIFRPLAFIFIIIVCQITNVEINTLTVLFALIPSYFLSYTVTHYLNKKSVKINYEFSASLSVHIYRNFFVFFLIALGPVLMSNIDILQLGNMTNLETVAIYTVASKIVNLTLLGLVSANLIIAPKISPLWVENKTDELLNVIRHNNLFSLGVTALSTAFLVLFIDDIVMLYGEEYIDTAKHIVFLLIIGQIVNVLCGPVLLVASLTNLKHMATMVLIVSGLVMWLLCFLLIPNYGLQGAAIANIFAYTFLNVALALFIYTKNNINTTVFNLILSR